MTSTQPPLTPAPTVLEVPTSVGPARVHLRRARGSRGVLLLGHGAGPSITTTDLIATTEAAVGAGWAVALVEQPWLVAGGRVAARTPILDTAWVSVAAALRARGGALATARGPWLVAGRSAGARVACRTALSVGADAVLCLSFPLHPPGKPESSRAQELAGALADGLPVSVVQGERDPFGTPAEVLAAVSLPPTRMYAVPGTHTIPRGSASAVGAAITEVLRGIPG